MAHKTPMQVLFIIQGYGSPSNRVRVLDLVPTLEKAGIRCTVLAYPRSALAKFRWGLRLHKFDAVVLQKKLLSRFAASLFKRLSKKIIFDFDDATHLRHDAEGGRLGRSIEARTVTTIGMADAIVAGNRILKKYAEQFNDHVYIIPSCVDVNAYPIKQHNRHNTESVAIGWIGSTANLHHLSLLQEVLKKLATRHSIVLHVVSGQSIEIPGVITHFTPWSLESQGQAISKFDIGIMPLENSSYSAGKCGYKALQCMATGIPVVISNVGGNADVVKHGIDGFLADNIVDFENHLETLITDHQLRATMGAKARIKIEMQYSVEIGGHALAQVLKEVVNG